jgi:RNA polymerase sigma-70 factor (ECF subfamily)
MNTISSSDFEQLFRTHNQALCDLAFNLVRDKDVAQDVVQEVFFKLWKNRERTVFGDQIRHYLFKATAHTALNHLRFNKKLVALDDSAPVHSLAAPARTDDAGYRELEVRVRESIDRLPPKCRAIYLLSRQEGLKYQEIADTLDLSVKTVENQMGIALEKLRQDLKPFLTTEFLSIAILALLGLATVWWLT